MTDQVRVQDLDAIKDEWSLFRVPTEHGARLCSADCYYKATNGFHYFIEFKNASREGLESSSEDGIPFPVSLMRKAVDSLGLAGMTLLQQETGKSIQDKAVYFVVYRASARDTLGALELNEQLTTLAGGRDPEFRLHPIMWSLDKLRESGLYCKVHTLPDNVFIPWAKVNLK